MVSFGRTNERVLYPAPTSPVSPPETRTVLAVDRTLATWPSYVQRSGIGRNGIKSGFEKSLTGDWRLVFVNASPRHRSIHLLHLDNHHPIETRPQLGNGLSPVTSPSSHCRRRLCITTRPLLLLYATSPTFTSPSTRPTSPPCRATSPKPHRKPALPSLPAISSPSPHPTRPLRPPRLCSPPPHPTSRVVSRRTSRPSHRPISKSTSVRVSSPPHET
jgi:hypothetical protein